MMTLRHDDLCPCPCAKKKKKEKRKKRKETISTPFFTLWSLSLSLHLILVLRHCETFSGLLTNFVLLLFPSFLYLSLSHITLFLSAQQETGRMSYLPTTPYKENI